MRSLSYRAMPPFVTVLRTSIKWSGFPAVLFAWGRTGITRKKPRRIASRSTGFGWISHPVTNRQFAHSCRATNHVTVAEIMPDPRDSPGMLPHMIYAGSLMFSPPAHPVVSATSASGGPSPGARNGGIPTDPEATSVGSTIIRSCMWPSAMRSPMRNGPARICQPKRNGNLQRAAGSTVAEFAWGDEFTPAGRHMANTWQGEFARRISMPMASSAPHRSPHFHRTVTDSST